VPASAEDEVEVPKKEEGQKKEERERRTGPASLGLVKDYIQRVREPEKKVRKKGGKKGEGEGGGLQPTLLPPFPLI